MSCSCCAQCQAELMVSNMELSRAKIERDNAILAKDYAEERLTAARLDLANMASTHTEDLKPGEDWAAKHCAPEPDTSDDATASYEALIKALRNDLEKEHKQNVELTGALKQAAVIYTASERDFRRALVVALAPSYPVTVDKLLSKVDEIVTEYLLRELRRERGVK